MSAKSSRYLDEEKEQVQENPCPALSSFQEDRNRHDQGQWCEDQRLQHRTQLSTIFDHQQNKVVVRSMH